jgi:hypothetical protein
LRGCKRRELLVRLHGHAEQARGHLCRPQHAGEWSEGAWARGRAR